MRPTTMWLVIVLVVLLLFLVLAGRGNQQYDGLSEPVRPVQSTQPQAQPMHAGPKCTTGCPCGNSCIDCSKKCRK